MTLLFLSLSCYLLGSLPVAWLVCRMITGQDLRFLGSGNVGVMNVAVSVARWAGLVVFLGEASKGILAVLLARALGGDEVLLGAAVVAAVAGTRWPIWLGGAGGRGNTVGAAALLLIAWPAIPAGGAIWVLARLLAGSSFRATRLTLVLIPFILGLVTQSWWFVLFGSILSVIYLSTQDVKTDDHQIIKERWPNLWAFLTGPPRA